MIDKTQLQIFCKWINDPKNTAQHGHLPFKTFIANLHRGAITDFKTNLEYFAYDTLYHFNRNAKSNGLKPLLVTGLYQQEIVALIRETFNQYKNKMSNISNKNQ